MNPLSGMIRIVDKALFLGISKKEISKRKGELDYEIGAPDSKFTKAYYEAYDSIDTKATAILQHVSIMIAVSALLFSQSLSSKTFKWLFGIEATLYVILALCCLRLFMTQHYSIYAGMAEDVVAKEALLDRTAKFTFLLSVALIVTFLVKLALQ